MKQLLQSELIVFGTGFSSNIPESGGHDHRSLGDNIGEYT